MSTLPPADIPQEIREHGILGQLHWLDDLSIITSPVYRWRNAFGAIYVSEEPRHPDDESIQQVGSRRRARGHVIGAYSYLGDVTHEQGRPTLTLVLWPLDEPPAPSHVDLMRAELDRLQIEATEALQGYGEKFDALTALRDRIDRDAAHDDGPLIGVRDMRSVAQDAREADRAALRAYMADDAEHDAVRAIVLSHFDEACREVDIARGRHREGE